MEAQPASVASIKQVPKLQQLQCFVQGRIASSRKLKGAGGTLFLTVIKTPAPDAYSHPSTLEVRSRSSLGAPGEDWSGVVTVSGFGRNYNTKPDENGEIRKVTTAENHLTVVES